MEREILTYINGSVIYKNKIETLPYNSALLIRAKDLRKAGNYPEVIFWKHVNRNKFHNIDFDRQRILGNYIVDFYIKTLGLTIEIDGSSHNDKDVYDNAREVYLISLGLKMYRISSLRVLHDLGNVMKEMESYIIANYSKA